MRVSWEFFVAFAYTFISFDNPGNNLQGVLCLLPVEIFDCFMFTDSESVKRDRDIMKTDAEQRANGEAPTLFDTNKPLPISLYLLSPCSCALFSLISYNLTDKLTERIYIYKIVNPF